VILNDLGSAIMKQLKRRIKRRKSKTKKTVEEYLPEGLQAVEILHVDTVDSQQFFSKLKANPAEKAACQTLLLDAFSDCCRQEGGAAANNWAGDGGHAFFSAKNVSGSSVRAARRFIATLPFLAEQTATVLGHDRKPDRTTRRFRIKAHFGVVKLSKDGRTDSGRSADFDAFLKHEKQLAPSPNELFITDQLLEQLRAAERDQFKLYKKTEPYGALSTALYRLSALPDDHGRKILTADLQPSEITPHEWRYLRSQIRTQRMNVVARNLITIGLMKAIAEEPEEGLRSELLIILTIRSVFRYLLAIYPDQKFKVTFWRPSDQSLDKVAAYPRPDEMIPRSVALNDVRYALVRAFRARAPVVTESVIESRLIDEWVDFDETQGHPARGLESALQIPVYWSKSEIGADFQEKELLGVFSVDCDKWPAPGLVDTRLS
jgi:hypothetical protein